jgi:hypothetical protein
VIELEFWAGIDTVLRVVVGVLVAIVLPIAIARQFDRAYWRWRRR